MAASHAVSSHPRGAADTTSAGAAGIPWAGSCVFRVSLCVLLGASRSSPSRGSRRVSTHSAMSGGRGLHASSPWLACGVNCVSVSSVRWRGCRLLAAAQASGLEVQMSVVRTREDVERSRAPSRPSSQSFESHEELCRRRGSVAVSVWRASPGAFCPGLGGAAASGLPPLPRTNVTAL